MRDSTPDPEAAEVMVGLEVHQQLATSRKLFCDCPVVKSEEFPYSFERRLRPAQSETGRLDPAAVFEFTRGRSAVYLWSPESCCLVDADEEPPHRLSEEAVEIGLEVASLLHSNIIDEIHVMRKIVIDGSNTTGFQRTAVVGIGGHILFREAKVGVQSVTIEEDAARIVAEDGSSRRFALDRLGVPLVEVALEPFRGSAEEVVQLALHLGRTLRSTGRVARGLGTIRQDLNVSVDGGKVVEVKGVQKLNLLPKVVSYEVKRQLTLAAVAERLKAAGVRSVSTGVCDAGGILEGTRSAVIRKHIESGGKAVCIKAGGLAGLMGWEPWPGVRLGREVAEVARANGLGGIIHSDEFGRQGISPSEESELRRECGAEGGDALVLLAGPAAPVERALPHVIARLTESLKGVPDETRAATDEGETRFMRPRPGAQRMYPETDVPDFVVEPGRLAVITAMSREPWEKAVERYGERYSLSQDLALKLFDSEYWELFTALASELNLEPSVVASTLVDLPVRLAREGLPEDLLTSESITEVLRAIDAGKLAKEAAPDVLRAIGKGEAGSVSGAIALLGLGPIDAVTLREIIDEVVAHEEVMVRERGLDAFAPLMGKVMMRVRGRADGRLVSSLLREKLASLAGKSVGKSAG